MHKDIFKNLRIIPVSQIFPFEWNQQKGKSDELLECNHIRHPFLVTRTDVNKYILLENSCDFYAYQSLGLKELPVQLVQADKLVLSGGEIGLYAFDSDDIEQIVEYSGGSIYSDKNRPDNKFLKLTQIEISIGDTKENLYLSNFESGGCSVSLENLFRYFEKHGGYRLIKSKKALSDSLTKIHLFKAKFNLPSIRLADIIEAVKVGNLYPPMITSVLTPVRMFNIDYPVSILKADISVKEKEEFLKELLQLREQTEKTSFYQGSIYLFNR